MQTKKRILLRKSCLSFLMEEDLIYYILESGFTNPQMYIVIRETPYDDDTTMLHLTLSELAKLIGISEMAIEIGLT